MPSIQTPQIPHTGYWRAGMSRDDAAAAQAAYLEEITRNMRITCDDHVLDVQCSTGAAAIWMARRFGCQVSAIDNRACMVSRAQDDVAAAGLQDQVDVRLCDLSQDVLPSATYHHVYTLEWLHRVDARAEVLGRIAEAMVPGGTLAISTHALSPGATWVARRVAMTMTGSRHLGRIDTLVELLSARGFDLQWMEDVTASTLYGSQDESAGLCPTSWLSPLWRALCAHATANGHWGLHFLWGVRRRDEIEYAAID